MKNIVRAMLITELKAEKRKRAFVILSILSGYLPIIQYYKCNLQRYKDVLSFPVTFPEIYTQWNVQIVYY